MLSVRWGPYDLCLLKCASFLPDGGDLASGVVYGAQLPTRVSGKASRGCRPFSRLSTGVSGHFDVEQEGKDFPEAGCRQGVVLNHQVPPRGVEKAQVLRPAAFIQGGGVDEKDWGAGARSLPAARIDAVAHQNGAAEVSITEARAQVLSAC